VPPRRAEVEATGLWTYNDLPKASRRRATGKPLLVSSAASPSSLGRLRMRQVVRHRFDRPEPDEEIVCVGLVQANAMDLGLFPVRL